MVADLSKDISTEKAKLIAFVFALVGQVKIFHYLESARYSYMVMSHQQNVGQSHNIMMVSKYSENVAQS
jgi:hypothetical protein